MNWIDYTIFVVLFFSAVLGLVSGPVLQFFRICSLFISFFTAFFFHTILSKILDDIFSPSTGNLLGYFIVFGAAFIVTYIFLDILRKVTGTWKMGTGLRLLGAPLGIIKGTIFCGIIIFGILLFCNKPAHEKIHNSKTASHIGKGMHTVVSLIPESILKRAVGLTQEITEKGQQKEIKPARDKERESGKDEDFKP